jgi:polar amino acid transport system ATP-binding protein
VDELPVIDIASAVAGEPSARLVREIDEACRATGFFYIVGHGIPEERIERLDGLAREFFALDDAEKARIAMVHGGRAWRGWFPLDGELTSGRPDRKEGLYLGQELPLTDPRVAAGVPLHGPNLFPARPAGLKDAVLDHMGAVTEVGHHLMRAFALALGLDADWFDRTLTADPLVLFRIFHYPPLPAGDERWSVGQHTDYGLLTILAQDRSGGLEVRGPDGWMAAPPIAGSFVVNLGDMLERMTGGRYRSTPHRVRNASGVDRLSFPLFFDPSWDAEVRPVPGLESPDPDGSVAPTERWDGRSPHDWTGTYGEYLLSKVGRVFPGLGDDVLPEPAP